MEALNPALTLALFPLERRSTRGLGPPVHSCGGRRAVPRILAITNQKGGVGKTTTGGNLAASLAAARRRTLLVDLDPQGNATMGSGVDKRHLPATLYHVLLGARRIADVRTRSVEGEYDLIPANRELAGAEIE